MNVFEKLYKDLKIRYGLPKGQWGLWCRRPKTEQERQEVAIGAILTQRTNWKNVEMALDNLKKARIKSLNDISGLDIGKLAPLIKPSGFYAIKAGYLLALSKFMLSHYGNLERMRELDTLALREALLKQRGVGPETADSILLYALDKPIFVIDEYTRRLVKKRGLAKNLSYGFLQKIFEKKLKKDFRLYQDFHALIVIDGKNNNP